MYKLLSHNDLDGVGCGVLAKLAFGKQVNVRYNSISGLNRQVEWFFANDPQDTFLFITDLSVNEENEKRLQSFHNEGGKVQLIDHHQTALSFNSYEWGHVVVEDKAGKLTSATSLFYEYLISHELLDPSNAVSEFVDLVRQYDTWEWEKNDNQKAKRLNSLFFLISNAEFEEKMLQRLQLTTSNFDFDEFEEQLLDMEDNKIERYINKKRKQLIQRKIDGYFAGIVHAESYHSELGNALGKEYPHLDYIVIINMGNRRAGFRTIHDHIDVANIASHYGGGGHAKASGCSLTKAAYKQFVAEAFELQPLKEDAQQNRYNVKQSSFGTLYKNRSGESFFLYPQHDNTWVMEKNKTKIQQTFSSFAEAEKLLKRNQEAWLVKDDIFVDYLKERTKKL